ncbi:LacI family DNA-binding transcriptional regulator [Loktanella sp. IMCC34160]|uniref:substrate-binding domain-containing protein n=1 Tax=Loktanella sp. IMCC34160 TaxID=2510646 RepID=UPI00101C0582|nr:LacI family DNA-binding transcriptional regulator [Loktanella sp. IMCC34160]RYG91778.1 LacI family DNA-binding transcriptional regulator [Loktanella sp. IMCC34160]
MNKNKKKTTIYDIAALADASPSAVSAVLNGTWEKRRLSRKLAARVMRIAEEQGYAVNVQASLLRREKSNIVGMIVPKYDNRYFGEIAEQFEELARARGMFPVVTCTQRDPDLEFEAARELISYQAECLISTGATDPDRISDFCSAAGVQSINLDLPGTKVPSVISDNRAGAYDLTMLILDRCLQDLGWSGSLRFVGGRLADHNTAARLEGFLAAHRDRGIEVPDHHVLAAGYSADSAARVLADFRPDGPAGIFVNSTISLEGVVRWHRTLGTRAAQVRYGCFDWDPFGSFLPGNVGMVEQDVSGMLGKAFSFIGHPETPGTQVLVPCRLHRFD